MARVASNLDALREILRPSASLPFRPSASPPAQLKLSIPLPTQDVLLLEDDDDSPSSSSASSNPCGVDQYFLQPRVKRKVAPLPKKSLSPLKLKKKQIKKLLLPKLKSPSA